MTARKVATDIRIFHLSGPPQHKMRAQAPKPAETKMITRCFGLLVNQIAAQMPKIARLIGMQRPEGTGKIQFMAL